jgi:hypothetical protein
MLPLSELTSLDLTAIQNPESSYLSEKTRTESHFDLNKKADAKPRLLNELLVPLQSKLPIE